MDLITEPGVSEDPAAEWAPSHALLRLCADGRFDSLLRIHRPSVPMVVFGRRDTRLPGYPRALQAARDEGFTPAIRAAGGRVVAYTDQALVVDEVRREPGAVRSQEQRFERSAFASSKCSASSEWTRGWVRFLVSTVLAPIRSMRAAAASWSVLPSGSSRRVAVQLLGPGWGGSRPELGTYATLAKAAREIGGNTGVRVDRFHAVRRREIGRIAQSVSVQIPPACRLGRPIHCAASECWEAGLSSSGEFIRQCHLNDESLGRCRGPRRLEPVSSSSTRDATTGRSSYAT